MDEVMLRGTQHGDFVFHRAYGVHSVHKVHRQSPSKKQKAPAQPCGQTKANWGLGVRHSLFPTLTLGAPLRGCQLPDAILHGKRSFRPHSRAVQRLAVTELSSEASWLASAGVCSASLRTRSRHVYDSCPRLDQFALGRQPLLTMRWPSATGLTS